MVVTPVANDTNSDPYSFIANRHAKYDQAKDTWLRCRDVESGEDAVKLAGEKYLPQLSGQETPEYDAYKLRALFYNATARTIQAILGAVFRKPTIVDPALPFVEKTAINTYEEICKIGRFGILVDVPRDGGEPYFVEYLGEQITNWHYQVHGDKKTLDMVTLREVVDRFDPSDFSVKPVVQYRVLELVYPPMEDIEVEVVEMMIRDGSLIPQYRMRVFEEQMDDKNKLTRVLIDEVFPTQKGAALLHLPFKIFNTTNCDPDIEKPPMLDLIGVNLSHYRSSADLEHGRHFTALPTAWVAGFENNTELRIGSGTAWVTDNVQARAGFLEFTGAGLGALEKALEQKEHLMAVLGARLFEDRKGVEAAETTRLRQSADTATAAAMSRNISQGLTECYQWYLDFLRTPEGSVAKVELNTDIVDTTMSSADLTALVAAQQSGAISQYTLLYNLQRGELLKPGDTIEEEMSRIEGDTARLGNLVDNSGAIP